MTRGKDYYRKFFQDIESDPIEEGDLEKLIEFIALLGDKTEDDGDEDSDALDAYDAMDPEDFLKLALGEKSEGGEDSGDEDDDSPWRFNKDEEYNDAGGDGIDSVGDDKDESEEKEKPDALTVSDEGKKEKGSPPKKGSGCVSDKGMKKVRRKEGPSEELLTRRNIAATLKDLRF